MKRILLILSLFLTSCYENEIPADKMYVADITNSVCAEYIIIDKTNFKVKRGAELALIAGSPCDRLMGFTPKTFKDIQEFIRSKNQKLEARNIELEQQNKLLQMQGVDNVYNFNLR